jgi:hypothetical protein
MSRENVEKVRRGYEAFAHDDLDAVLELLDANVDWYPAIAPILGVETLRGREPYDDSSRVIFPKGSTSFERSHWPLRTSATTSW